ncbi:MAG: hypothetical protein HFF36_06325 [Coprobacillus sp.]|nr:hypothetical protein [Coprobacillus sp.]
MKNFILIHIFAPVVAAGTWAPVTKLFTNFLDQTKVFLQGLTIGFVVVMSIYYKFREIASDAQEEQQFTSKVRRTLIACAFIFLIPALANVLKSFFNS